MRIAQLAPLWTPVPPVFYGGIERIVSYLTEGLVKRGHSVTIFASGDSKTKASLFSVVEKHLYSNPQVAWNNPNFTLLNASACYEEACDFDIIHSHIDYFSLFFSRLVRIPTVHTLHNPLGFENNPEIANLFKNASPNDFFVSISNSQRRPLLDIKYVATVYNAIDLGDFPFSGKPQDYLAWLGRISRLKGVMEAILVAKRLGMKLVLAGEVRATDQEFYEKNVKPQIDGKQIVDIGVLAQLEKAKFLKDACCLLNPLQWDEPFGLVMIEAMVCGTPVVAFNRGSVPEIVVDGKTGFIVETVEEMVEAIKKIDQIDRRACRAHVEKNFTVEKMVDGYEKVYQKILSRG